ncbi:MAG: 4-hydroxymandelate oxidase [Planctomycetes bacterium]|nr:4-hydroxymandelate oxidase [Planctomycetota bacterium]
MDGFLNLPDIERAAHEALPPMVGDYYRGGAMDEATLRANRDAFARAALRPRVLVDVSRRDLSTTVLGRRTAMPILLAPTAFHRLAHPDGELATARAARAAGVVQILSTLSTTPVEDVCRANPGGTWFQLYVYRDREATRALVGRAADAGCAALVVTVDAPLLGRRERDIRGGFHLPSGIVAANVTGAPRDMPRVAGDSALAAWFQSQIDPSLSWKDLSALRAMTSLPILLKGVLRGDDARRAADAGVDGIIVSNHGGRQMDGAVASLDALPEVVAAAGTATVLFDGGVRRGADVLRALALGARGVLVGRPQLHGLAVGGEAGVARVLEILRFELDHAMALCGCPDIASITRDLVR